MKKLTVILHKGYLFLYNLLFKKSHLRIKVNKVFFFILPWKGELGEGVSCEMADGGVGEELHDHADVLGGGVEHHRGEVHGRADTEIHQ